MRGKGQVYTRSRGSTGQKGAQVKGKLNKGREGAKQSKQGHGLNRGREAG